MVDMALHRHTHAFGLPPVVQAADNIQISPSSAEKRTGSGNTSKSSLHLVFQCAGCFFRFGA